MPLFAQSRWALLMCLSSYVAPKAHPETRTPVQGLFLRRPQEARLGKREGERKGGCRWRISGTSYPYGLLELKLLGPVWTHNPVLPPKGRAWLVILHLIPATGEGPFLRYLHSGTSGLQDSKQRRHTGLKMPLDKPANGWTSGQCTWRSRGAVM